MFRRYSILVAGIVTLLAIPGLLQAQTRKPAHPVVRPTAVTPKAHPVKAPTKVASPKVSSPKVPVSRPKVTPAKVTPSKMTPPKMTPPKVTPPKATPPKFPIPKTPKVPTPKVPTPKILPDGPWGWGPWGNPWWGWGDPSWRRWGDRWWDKRFFWEERFSASFFAAGGIFSGLAGVPGMGFPAGGPTSGGSSSSSSSSDVPADSAGIMRAYADIIEASERARMLREDAEQKRLDTLKKKAETQAYLESITPSWTQKQAKIDREILVHAQGTTNLFEITSGKALNILLADLRKTCGRKVVSSSNFLAEEALGHINVTTKNGNLGLLRNEGAFTWPQALIRDDIVSEEDRAVIKVLARALIRSKGNFPRNMLEDLDRFLVSTESKLASKVNDIPTGQYLEAKRFLSSFQAARTALENGEGAAYFKFQKWVRGGKTIQDVVDYMVQEGLEFASAVPGDEGAYRALHSALASYNMQVNSQLAAAGTTSKE
jgi:hypothetical protein